MIDAEKIEHSFGSEEPVEEPLPYARPSRLAIFGGSFDPIHNGHLKIANYLVEKDLCDEVMFIPAKIPPHKVEKNLAPAKDRLKMLMLALEENQAFSTSDIELQRKGKSYTYDTISVLKRVYPDCKLLFVMGMDSLCQLDTWHRASELVQLVDFIIYPRPGYAQPIYINLEKALGPRYANRLLDGVLPEDEVLLSDISSSAIREGIARGEDMSRFLPEKVWEYIKEHHIYSNKEESENE